MLKPSPPKPNCPLLSFSLSKQTGGHITPHGHQSMSHSLGTCSAKQPLSKYLLKSLNSKL